MEIHSSCIRALSWSEFIIFCLPAYFLLRVDHRSPLGLNSGEFSAHKSKHWSLTHFFIFALCHGALKCWKIHGSSPNSSWINWIYPWRRFWYHDIFPALFLSRIVIVSEPTPPDEKEPQTWMFSGCFTVDGIQEIGLCLPFPLQAIFKTFPRSF